MNKILNATRSFIFAKQRTIFSSALLLAGMIIVARLFGFLRYRVLSTHYVKEELDIFFASFRIPDLIFEVLITGALTTSFIPIFIQYQKNNNELSKNISSIINLIMILMTAFIILATIFLDRLIPLITPGYNYDQIETIIFYSRLLLIGQLPFLILGNFLTAISQSIKAFFLPALAPIIYNLSIILFTYFFASTLKLTAPVLGVIIGAILFLVVQTPIINQSSFHYRFVLEKTAGLIEFLKLIIPRTLTVIVAQVDATIDLSLTSLLGGGAYTVFYFAQHLQLLPVSVLGIAFGQASLPYLSEVYSEKRIEEFKKIIIDSILNLFFLVIPIASFFIFARTPLVRLFFGGQKFDWSATVSTAITLSFFAIAIPFHTIYYFLTRCFYSILDSRTPFYISLISISINLFLSLSFILIYHLPVWSLAIAFSLSMSINVILLFLIFYKKINGLNLIFLLTESVKIITATLVSTFFSHNLLKLLDGLIFDTSRTINVFLLLVTVGIAYYTVYIFLSWLLDVKEIYLISKLLTKVKEYQKKLLEIYTSYE